MPIRELSRRTGVSPDLLRKWEQRYALLRPSRTPGNQRLYSGVDEARVRLMQRHVRDGMPPAQAAELAAAAAFRIGAGASEAPIEPAAQARAQILQALERYDETSAELIVEPLSRSFTVRAILRDVYLPLLHELGERWASKHLSVAQEHFASHFIQSRLLMLARGWDRGLGPRALLACPPGEQHTFGLIAFGIVLHQLGWRITYLGADTPCSVIAQAGETLAPRLLVLSATSPERLQVVQRELRNLGRRFPTAAGGAGASPQLCRALGLRHLAGDCVGAADGLLF
jgi:MerR family transcriptional regulator, light-induced transcriptional regulator